MVISVKPIVCITEAFGLGRGVRSCGVCCAASGTAARTARPININLRIAIAPFVSKPAEMLTLWPGDPAVLEQGPAAVAVDDFYLHVGIRPHTTRTAIECPSETRMRRCVVPVKCSPQTRIVRQGRSRLADRAIVEEQIHFADAVWRERKAFKP